MNKMKRKELDLRKVVVIGDGMVGSSIAYTLLLQSAATNVVLIDVNVDKTIGDALDMNHAVSLSSPKEIKAGDYSDIVDAHIIIITAGANQKPGETRIDLLNKNKAILHSIADQMLPYLNKDSIILMVTNPVDILTYYMSTILPLPHEQIIGSGTVLDSGRLKYLISEDTGIDPRNIHAYVIGEHGDSELAAFSVTSIAGISILDFCKSCGKCKKYIHLEKYKQMEKEVVNSAYEIINRKGSTYYGIAAATKKIVDAIINDTHSVLTVSSYIKNALDGQISDVYLSVPSVVSERGATKTLWPEYSLEEKNKLIDSANKLKQYY